MKNCPSCQSDQIKKASLVRDEGIRAGGGIGLGHGGVAVGAGVSSSMLAAKCLPPAREQSPFVRMVLSLFVLLVLTAIFFPDWLGYFVLYVFLPSIFIVPFIAFKQSSQMKARYETALADYEKTFMCLRCGTFYKPFD